MNPEDTRRALDGLLMVTVPRELQPRPQTKAGKAPGRPRRPAVAQPAPRRPPPRPEVVWDEGQKRTRGKLSRTADANIRDLLGDLAKRDVALHEIDEYGRKLHWMEVVERSGIWDGLPRSSAAQVDHVKSRLHAWRNELDRLDEAIDSSPCVSRTLWPSLRDDYHTGALLRKLTGIAAGAASRPRRAARPLLGSFE